MRNQSNPFSTNWYYPFEDYDEIYMESFKDGASKFYRMIKTTKVGWKAEYGRIGKKAQKKTYTKSDWEDMLNDKLSDTKGYVIKSTIKTSPYAAPVVIEKEEEEYNADNCGDEWSFDIHIQIDRTMDLSTHPFMPRFTELSMKMSKLLDALDDIDVEILFNIRKSYWKTGKLLHREMRMLNDIYIKINELN